MRHGHSTPKSLKCFNVPAPHPFYCLFIETPTRHPRRPLTLVNFLLSSFLLMNRDNFFLFPNLSLLRPPSLVYSRTSSNFLFFSFFFFFNIHYFNFLLYPHSASSCSPHSLVSTSFSVEFAPIFFWPYSLPSLRFLVFPSSAPKTLMNRVIIITFILFPQQLYNF